MGKRIESPTKKCAVVSQWRKQGGRGG